MNVHIPFDNSYAELPEHFFARQNAKPVDDPKLLAFNQGLAKDLGITAQSDEDLAQVFSGNSVPTGAEPIAQLYAGHQFGTYNPQLGDGRALLLGEVISNNGLRSDIQLKGSGPTPFSRMGDGLAWLGPVLREYVVSEAMHAMGVPTTRALAAVSTAAPVIREQGPLPGAVLTRVASSHIRVGTFQVFAHRGDLEGLKRLTDYTIARHAPNAQGPLDLLRQVCAAQAELVAAWMSFGFIHGVMNTDNCTISGETIDYGPCAFMDAFHPGRVFSSIDHAGRYAFGNQPRIAVWNMAQLATALIQQMPDIPAAAEEATQIVQTMPDTFEAAWLRRFCRKLGISNPQDGDADLIERLLEIMTNEQSDFTNMFRALMDGTGQDHVLNAEPFDAWHTAWQTRIGDEPDALSVMARANPVFIPRNHRIEEMITSAVAGDLAPFNRLIHVLSRPFTEQPDASDLRRPPTPDEVVPATFCGT